MSVSVTPPGALELGGEASLQCRVAGLSSEPQWTKPDGGPAGSARVHLQPVGPEHAGTWTCTFSTNGQTYSEDLEIKIIGNKVFFFCLFFVLQTTTMAP